MNEKSPAATVSSHVEVLLRGGDLPLATSREAELLRQAVRCLLASEAYPRATAIARDELALSVLRSLNARMRADIVVLSQRRGQ